ncbi:protein FAM98C [Leptodactylus fuscus]|uniref:protein FAM98C n=1 Tax=Leptodactylus fuscus TaxID=238119 RepID=UPI003F4F2EBF
MSESGSEDQEPGEKMEEEAWRGRELREAAGLLRELGYPGLLCNEDALRNSCESGAECQMFTSLCVWLVSELKSVCDLVENVSPTEGPADFETFQLEMSGVVSELHCPYTSLTSGNVTSRLLKPANCLQLIVFLSTELEAARLLKRSSVSTPEPRRHNEEVLNEFRLIGQALGLPEISLDVPVTELMKELKNKITELSGTVHLSAPLFNAQLQPEQWETLQDLHYSMLREYECRMRMLVTRFDVTVQSFHWSERAQVKGVSMNEVYIPIRESLTTESGITISHLLAAREDYSRIHRTCNATLCQKTRTAIQKVLMTGAVPDRGGRPNEIEAPMPMWEKRREGGSGHQRWGKKNKRKRK